MNSAPPTPVTPVDNVITTLDTGLPPWAPQPLTQRVAVPYSTDRRPVAGRRIDSVQGRILSQKYRVTFILGKGGMSTVYLARHVDNGRHFAIKVLRKDLAKKSVHRRRFINELDAVARIDHPAVVKMYDRGELEDGRLYLVMEYIFGRTLRTVLGKRRMTPKEAIPTIVAIADGLRVAHRAGVIHRDLKPGNILIPRRPKLSHAVKIVDFGIARIRDGESLTESSQIVGTPHYISPEQVLGEPIDQRTDVYALGVVMYEMMTGVHLFHGKLPVELLQNHVKTPPVPMRIRCPDLGLPKEIDTLIMRCLAKKPDERPGSMDELTSSLIAIQT